jgi:thymidylate synthase
MIKADFYYLKNLNDILDNGQWDENPRPKWKDGTPAHSKFITQVFEEYDISNGEFPITTLRNTAIKMGIKEIFWIYQLQSNKLSDARELGITWWNDFDIGDGTIGKRYGYTVKKYNLINRLLTSLKEDPCSRRHIINLYQENDLRGSDGLFPCAYETLWSVRKKDDKDFILDMTLIQRSNDYIIAGYINKIQYVALQMMVAGHLGYKVGKFCHLTQNLHVYDRHFEAVTEILSRKPLNTNPKIELIENKDFYKYSINDFAISEIEGIMKLNADLEIAV